MNEATSHTRARIYEWIATYRDGVVEALRRRKASGRPPKLAGNALQKITEWLLAKIPGN